MNIILTGEPLQFLSIDILKHSRFVDRDMVMRYLPGIGVGHTYSWEDSAATNEAASEIDAEVAQEDDSDNDDEDHTFIQEDGEDVEEEDGDGEDECEESAEEDRDESDDDEFLARHEEEY